MTPSFKGRFNPMNGRFTMKDLVQRLIWAVLGYFSALYGVVNIPPPL